MKTILQAGLLLLGICFNLYNADARTLKEQIDFEMMTADQAPSTEFLNHLRGRHVVLIDGFGNELASIINSYYRDTIKILNKWEISFDHLAYSSSNPIDVNARYLETEIERIWEATHKPLIVVGHSMGGAEALYMVLKEPRWVLRGKIDRIVLIQPAIGGSYRAEEMKDTIKGRLTRWWYGAGIESLGYYYCRVIFQVAFMRFKYELTQMNSDPDQLFDMISKKIFYVRGFLPKGQEPSFGLKIVRTLFPEQSTYNDGRSDLLLDINDQILNWDRVSRRPEFPDVSNVTLAPTLGTDLGILEADHIELVVGRFVSRSDKPKRKAFTRAFLKQIYQDLFPGI